jgi:signal transduction histidine kinase
MVYRTVQMHDGEIEVQSMPGSGTTFRMLLPRA